MAEETPISPSAALAQQVMAAVRREAALPAALVFPWRRMAACLAACAVLLAWGARGLAGSSQRVLDLPGGTTHIFLRLTAGPEALHWADLLHRLESLATSGPLSAEVAAACGLASAALAVAWLLTRFTRLAA